MGNWISLYLGPLWFGFKIAILLVLLGLISYQYADIKYLQHQIKERDATIVECTKAKEKMAKEKDEVILNLTNLKNYYMRRKPFCPDSNRPTIDDLLGIPPR